MANFHRNTLYHEEESWAAERAKKEIEQGMELLSNIDQNIIAFAGSARVSQENRYYQHCQQVAKTLGQAGYALLSGGGPGIMHAVNSGATEVGARSIGLKSDLLRHEQVTEDIYTDQLSLHYFFTRRFLMLIKTTAYIYYPGGIGTLNELLENMMLMQNNIVDVIPMICVGQDYWSGLFEWMEHQPVESGYMDKADLSLVTVLDNIPDIISAVKR